MNVEFTSGGIFFDVDGYCQVALFPADGGERGDCGFFIVWLGEEVNGAADFLF